MFLSFLSLSSFILSPSSLLSSVVSSYALFSPFFPFLLFFKVTCEFSTWRKESVATEKN